MDNSLDNIRAKRKYETSHPWLSFDLEMGSASPQLWLALGEAASKCEHLADIPLKPDLAEKLHEVYLAKGALATTAIEGNTLSEADAIRHVRGKLKLPKSQEYLGKEIDNVIGAFNVVLNRITQEGSFRLNPELIKFFNESVLDGLELEEGVVPGQIRMESVGVGSYRAAPATDCTFLVEKFCDWIESADFEPHKGQSRLVYGLVQAIVAHVYFVWIHPFGDGNGRTARLIEAVLLLRAGVPSSAAHLFSNHYNLTRIKYYKKLEESSENGGDLLPFMHYAIEGFVQLLRECIDDVKMQQILVAWENHIYELFGEKETPKSKRQRNLVLALTRAVDVPVLQKNITSLSPEMAREYYDTHQKTLARDLEEMVQRQLLVVEPDGYRANLQLVLAFLPATNPDLSRLFDSAISYGGRQLRLFDED